MNGIENLTKLARAHKQKKQESHAKMPHAAKMCFFAGYHDRDIEDNLSENFLFPSRQFNYIYHIITMKKLVLGQVFSVRSARVCSL